MTKRVYRSRTFREKIFSVRVLGKKNLNSEGKIPRQEGVVIEQVGEQLGQAKTGMNCSKTIMIIIRTWRGVKVRWNCL